MSEIGSSPVKDSLLGAARAKLCSLWGRSGTGLVYDNKHVLLAERRRIAARRLRVAAFESGSDKKASAPAGDAAERNARVRKSAAVISRWVAKGEVKDLSALCLSGGGIRSAAFALGVTQGLARHGLLYKFDYLSTVSGGGYLGSFLTAWSQRRGYEYVNKAMISGSGETREESALTHLRRFSRYLAPQAGVVSTDMLTIVAIFARNVILNWLTLGSVAILALAVLKLALLALIVHRPLSPAAIVAVAVVAVALIGVSELDSALQRPGWGAEQVSSELGSLEPKDVARWEYGPLLIGAALLSLLALNTEKPELAADLRRMPKLGALMYGAVWFMAYQFAQRGERRGSSVAKTALRDENDTGSSANDASFTLRQLLIFYFAWIACGAVAGAFFAVAKDLMFRLPTPDEWRTLIFLGAGPVIVSLCLFLAETIYAGLSSSFPWSDGEREWLARASSLGGQRAIYWLLAVLGPAFGSWFIFKISEGSGSWSIPTLTGGTGVVAFAIALAGKAKKTAATVKQEVESLRKYSASALLIMAAGLVIIVFVALLSALVDLLLFNEPFTRALQEPQTYCKAFAFRGLLVLAVAGAGALLSSWVIDINAFSLHSIYRNRLLRAFLGASNLDKRQNPLTGFDDRDNMSMSDLWPNCKVKQGRVPPQFHVVNAAMNVVATTELAWQERKAMPFVFTPIHVGSGQAQGDGAYRLARDYGSVAGIRRRIGCNGVSLGTAMTISGAAASPNMGYHSSPALSLLMTLFNVRLGAWKGNPGPAGEKTYWRKGPRLSARPLIAEALGQTREDRPYVYLSDGGHFENLGLYEMIRRRCRLIVVSDAGCDPNCHLEDLGNALRKISIDLKVEIDFSNLAVRARSDSTPTTPYHGVAQIKYPDDPQGKESLILYVKANYRKDEPPPVFAYACANKEFPHESTADQFFGEAQFEAYRALGEHIINRIASGGAKSSIRALIEAAAVRPPT